MLPVLNATSPPAVPFEPTLTAPLADEPAIVPGLVPTSPPTKLSVPPLTIAPVADESVIVPRLVATSPPEMPLSPACTLPSALED